MANFIHTHVSPSENNYKIKSSSEVTSARDKTRTSENKVHTHHCRWNCKISLHCFFTSSKQLSLLKNSIFICIAKQHPVPPVLFLVLRLLSQTPTKFQPTYWSIFRFQLWAVICAIKYFNHSNDALCLCRNHLHCQTYHEPSHRLYDTWTTPWGCLWWSHCEVMAHLRPYCRRQRLGAKVCPRFPTPHTTLTHWTCDGLQFIYL